MLFADGGLHLWQVVAVGGFWFWVLVAALLVAVTIFTENENGWLAFLSVALFLSVIQFLGNADWLGYVWHHPHYILGGVLVYYVAGVVYSVVRWKVFCDNRREEYDEAKADFLDQIKVKYTNAATATIPVEKVADWKRYLDQRFGRAKAEEFQTGVKFRNHSGLCGTWATYWPCSMFWTLLNDPLRKMLKHTMNQLKGVYESIASRSWQGVDKDFAEAPPAPKPLPDDAPVGLDGKPLVK